MPTKTKMVNIDEVAAHMAHQCALRDNRSMNNMVSVLIKEAYRQRQQQESERNQERRRPMSASANKS